MALASAPTTPDRPVHPAVRRAFTAPIKPSTGALRPKGDRDDGAETLFAHPAAKIVSFTSSTPSFSGDGSGTLPWASVTERTVAAGPLRIYRVLGSVAFLNSGNILHPIFAKSQCWCVDGVSKFVLKIRDRSYYRIELPATTDDERNAIGDIQNVFTQVLQYEQTPCPFKRGFTVDLPDPPETPVKKVPWRPKHSTRENRSESLESASRPVRGDFKKERPLYHESSSPEEVPLRGHHTPARKVADFPHDASETSSIDACDFESDEHEPKASDIGMHEEPTMERIKPSNITPADEIRRTLGPRTTTAPSKPSTSWTGTLITSNCSLQNSDSSQEYHSFSSSMDSFHSWDSDSSSLSKTPGSKAYDSDHLDVPRIRRHRRDQSEVTVTAQSQTLWDLSDEETPTTTDKGLGPGHDHRPIRIDGHWDEVTTPSPPGLRVRRTFRKRRAESPLPSSTNLLISTSSSQHLSRCRMTKTLMEHTCSYLLKPPVQLVALMIQIALKIARGTLQGSTFILGGKDQVPGTWDFSSDNSETGGDNDDDDEDDFGFKLSKTISDRATKDKEDGGSWEID